MYCGRFFLIKIKYIVIIYSFLIHEKEFKYSK